MQDDGGSHTNIYYQIDVDNSQVIKCEDKYVGFKGYEYEGKILYKKTLNETELKDLTILINNMIEKKDEEKDFSINNYELSTIDYEKIIVSDESLIDEFENLVKENNL